MSRIKTHRFIITVITIATLGLTLESIMLHWEFWVGPLLIIGFIFLWALHITQSMSAQSREVLYLAYSMLAVFYHGVHDTSFFDVATVITLFLIVFSFFNRLYMMNLIVAEYTIIMMIQFVLASKSHLYTFDFLNQSRVAMQIITTLLIYFSCKKTIKGRLAQEDALSQRDKDLEAFDQDIEDFLSNISHELRTPVNVVNGMALLLMKQNADERLKAIKAAGQRLSEQIDDIQDYSEIQRDQLTLEEENYMTASLINDMTAVYNRYTNASHLNLSIEVDAAIPSVMKGDIKKIMKIFRHLLDNAFKFTKFGGIYVKLSYEEREYGVNLCLEVIDTGIGMNRHDRSMAATRFFQVNKQRDRSVGGIGLGLPIVFGLVHKMGGFINFDSTLEKGTIVRITIPQQVVERESCFDSRSAENGIILLHIKPGNTPFSTASDSPLTFDGVSCLIVDDEPMNLVVARDLFQGYKMEIDTAESGREAIEKCKETDYDIIFMDHMMPGMDGVAAMKQIRATETGKEKTSIFIALTANAVSGVREMFIKEGFDGFISKPIIVADFERVMKQVLSDSRVNV